MWSDQELPCSRNPGLWFSSDPDSIKQAKAICASCVFRLPCLADTLEYEELAGERKAGVFGGLTAIERTRQRPLA